MIPRSLKFVEYCLFCGHFWKHCHCQFYLHSRDISVRDFDFSDFHTLLPGSPLIRENKSKKELMDCYTRRKSFIARADWKKFVNDCVSRNGCIELILPNQIKWSWYHSFQKTMFYLMISKYVRFSNISNEIRAFLFFGTPGTCVSLSLCTHVCMW